jgi:hypothetical protein
VDAQSADVPAADQGPGVAAVGTENKIGSQRRQGHEDQDDVVVRHVHGSSPAKYNEEAADFLHENAEEAV